MVGGRLFVSFILVCVRLNSRYTYKYRDGVFTAIVVNIRQVIIIYSYYEKSVL